MNKNLLLALALGIFLWIFSEYNCFEMHNFMAGCKDEICEFTYCQDQYRTPLFRILDRY